MKSHYIIPIFVPHKGCPHDCIFCNQKKITGQINEVDSSFVRQEIEKYLGTIPARQRMVEVSFFGGSFTGLPVHEQISLLEPAKEALDGGMIDAIRLSTRPDYIDSYILDTLKDYGVSIIELGVQSMDEDVLYMSNRGHSVEDVYRASELIKEYGFTLGLQMMVGLPGDTEEKDIKTAREFIKISPSMVRIYPALVIKDTYMEHMYSNNKFNPLSLDTAVETCSKLYLMFTDAGINVIRIGLQPTETINEGRDIISGPFHPSFREHVESKVLNDMILFLYKKNTNSAMNIHINGRSISKLYAGGKKYYNRMLENIKGTAVRVVTDSSVPEGSLKLAGNEISQILSIKDYSHISLKSRNF